MTVDLKLDSTKVGTAHSVVTLLDPGGKAITDAKDVSVFARMLDMDMAIESIAGNQRYFPRHLAELVKRKNVFEFEEFDMAVLKLMAQGMRQKAISTELQRQKMRPSSLWLICSPQQSNTKMCANGRVPVL